MIIDEDVDDFLAHFGVKGMRWGVRNRHPERHLSTTQGAVSVVGGYATFKGAAWALSRLEASPLLILGGGLAAGVAGGKFVANYFRTHGAQHMKNENQAYLRKHDAQSK